MHRSTAAERGRAGGPPCPLQPLSRGLCCEPGYSPAPAGENDGHILDEDVGSGQGSYLSASGNRPVPLSGLEYGVETGSVPPTSLPPVPKGGYRPVPASKDGSHLIRQYSSIICGMRRSRNRSRLASKPGHGRAPGSKSFSIQWVRSAALLRSLDVGLELAIPPQSRYGPASHGTESANLLYSCALCVFRCGMRG